MHRRNVQCLAGLPHPECWQMEALRIARGFLIYQEIQVTAMPPHSAK